MKHHTIFLGAIAIVALSFTSALAAPVLDFEASSVPVGTRFGETQGDQPGDVILTSPDGIVVSLAEFQIGSQLDFFEAQVGGRFAKYFDTTPLEMDNISIVVDFSALSFDVTAVKFEFREFGGWVNFGVNAEPVIQRRSLVDLPIPVSPNIEATTDGDTMTIQAFNGAIISQILLGGQELVVDNILAIPEPTTAIFVTLGLGWISRKKRMNRHKMSGGLLQG